MRNLFGFKREKHYLSVEEAQNILKYGFRNITTQDALSGEIEDLESSIKSKSGLGYRVLTKVYQDYKQDLIEKVFSHFKEKGFVVDLYKNPGIKGFIILVIGW